MGSVRHVDWLLKAEILYGQKNDTLDKLQDYPNVLNLCKPIEWLWYVLNEAIW